MPLSRSEDLIVEARCVDAPEVHARLIDRLADALEAAEAERDDLETRLSGYLCDSTGGLLSKTGYDVRTMVAHTEEYYDRLHAEDRAEVEAERDAALAVIENVRGLVEMWEWIPERGDVLEALSSVPADVLRERDRRVRAEALREAAESWGADPDAWGDNDKDYRNELRDRADRIEQNSEGNET